MRRSLWPLALVALAIASRLPFQSGLPYAWDSILYMRALQRFDVLQHQPQPPGYIFYVGTAWLLNQLLGDAHRSLVLLSVLGTAWAALALYLLGRHLYGHPVGLMAPAVLLASPTFWAYGEVAYPYTTLAAICSTMAWLVATTLTSSEQQRRRNLLVTTAAYSFMAGFRQDILLLLMPLYMVTLWRRPFVEWALAAATGIATCLTWIAPSAYFSGGLQSYMRAVLEQTQHVEEAHSLLATGLAIFEENARPLLLGLWHGLYLAAIPAAFALAKRILTGRVGRDMAILALWILPPSLFYIAVHIGDVGYTFSILPAFCLVAAYGIQEIAVSTSAYLGRYLPSPSAALSLGLTMVLVGSNAGQFLLRPASSPYSVQGLHCHDAQMASKLSYIRQHFPKGPTVLLGVNTYQHTSYFLSEYWSYDKLAAQKSFRYKLPKGMKWAVVVDDYLILKGSWERVAMPCDTAVRFRSLSGSGAVLVYYRPILAIYDVEEKGWKPR